MQTQLHDPDRVRQFIAGEITLAELEGMSKTAQYAMARIGFGHWKDGRLSKAKQVFEGLAALDPYDSYFQIMLGSIAQRSEEFELAEQRYTRALQLNPVSSVAYANRGEVRLMKGELPAAAMDLTRAIAIDPDAKEPTTLRARVLATALKARLQRRAS